MLTGILFFCMVISELIIAALYFRRDDRAMIYKAYIRLGGLLAFVLLVISPIMIWSFRWYTVAVWLMVMAIIAVARIYGKKPTKGSKAGVIVKTILKVIMIGMVCMPSFIFPQASTIKPDGSYGIKTMTYTWTDETRDETFTKEADHRKITVQFWYPTKDMKGEVKAEGNFPLVVFSHGAFGVRASNYSTYTELASHGYVVCSIDHPYHSFYTKGTDGSSTMIDSEFLNQALTLSNQEDTLEKYEMTQGWYKLRFDDMSFCLKQIRALARQTSSSQDDEVFSMIDLDRIGLMGHSLGGAEAAGVARADKGIKAVAVIDGTMLGEEVGFEDGKEVVTDEPYPVPILNFYNGPSYKEIEKCKDIYPNTLASKSQEHSYQIVITNAGHLNFTDLVLVAPILADNLEKSTNSYGINQVGRKACLKYINETLLEFFDGYLKGEEVSLPKEQVVTLN